MRKKTIGVLVGSLRKESFNKKIAKKVMELMPDTFECKIIEIGNLPLYNEDIDSEGNSPKSYTDFREELKAVDGFLFVTPEYNRSVPAALKNALDVGSRPYGQSVWDGKPGGIISASTGRISGFGANHHLRQSMVFLNVLMLQQPEAYMGDVAGMFDEKGNMTDERSIKFLKTYADAFSKWVELITQ